MVEAHPGPPRGFSLRAAALSVAGLRLRAL